MATTDHDLVLEYPESEKTSEPKHQDIEMVESSDPDQLPMRLTWAT